MSLENNIPNYDLLAKFFAGEASLSEIEMVENWKNSGNLEEFYKIKKTWEAVDNSSKQFDVDKAFSRVNSKIKFYESRKRIKVISMIAAAILLIIAIPLVVLNVSKSNLKQEMISFQTQDSISTLMLEDGSKITVNKNTTIQYANNFKDDRFVKLSGEAYFEVQHIDNNSFVIQTKNLQVTVVGTKFNVKSLKDSEIVEVSVTEGIVRVQNIDSEEYIEIRANEKVTFNTANFEVIKDTVNIENNIQWLTNKIVFNNSGMSEVASTISSIYSVDVVLNISNPEDLKINTDFENSSLEDVLKVLELTLDLQIEVSGDTVTISDEK
jgi:ferric-dicitrate binding protein FerR (iron transport regulator)